MPSPARPRSRMSMNPHVGGLAERDMNSQQSAQGPTAAAVKGKRRAAQSMGGNLSNVKLPGVQPPKSILKAYVIPQFNRKDENTNVNVNNNQEEEGQQTLVYESSIMEPAADATLVHRSRQESIARAEEIERQDGYTVNFSSSGRPSISNRRVAFAPSAHVRMFEAPANTTSRRRSSIAPPPGPAPGAVPGQPHTFTLPPPAPAAAPGPRVSNAGHGRRSSIQNIAAIGVMDTGDQSADMSIEQDTDEEEGDSDDGSVPANQAIYNISAAGNDDEGEMSMEMTQNFGGGVIQQQGEDSFMTESSIRSDEEKTMEFTVAIGGVLPTAPPSGAQRGRASVGYNHLTSGQPIVPGEGEDDMEMDETVAFGGIINYANPDDTISTSASDDTIHHGDAQETRGDRTMTFSFGDLQAAARQERELELEQEEVEVEMDMSMDMTTVGRGIFANTTQQSHTHAHVHLHTTTTQSTTPKSPGPFTQSLTRPSGSTPSFARPTASSASKTKTLSTSPEKEIVKRNIFGPSPSPYKSTPRKSGMATAGQVAKRLSFGSASGSVHGSAKRSRQEDEEESMGKRQRLSIPSGPIASVPGGLGDSIFGRPGQSQSQPRQSLALGQTSSVPPTPTSEVEEQEQELEVQPAKSPMRPRQSLKLGTSKSPMKSLIPTINIREEAQGQGQNGEWPLPVIGLASFLDTIGVQFVDTLPSMGRRKSVGKGLLGGSVKDRSFQPFDYTEAKIQCIFLHTYIWATTRFRSSITTSRSEITYTESLYDQYNPPVITEYLAANEHDRSVLDHFFRQFKLFTQLKAKGDWYEWKMGMMDKIRPDVEGVLVEVQEDESKLDEMSAEVDEYLPQLRERAQLLQAELAREREVVAELEACDQGELSDWKGTVLDTKKALDEQLIETTELSTKLSDLRAKLAEYESVIHDHTSAISSAKSKCDEYTKSDVGKIQHEYTTLQDLHLWKINFLRADQLEMEYASELRVTMNCSAFIPDLNSCSISLLSSKCGTATSGLFDLVRGQLSGLMKMKQKLSLSQMIQKIGQLWNAAQRIRHEFKLVSTQYPTTYSINQGKAQSKLSLGCSTAILIPSKKAKVILEFTITGDISGDWPAGLSGVQVDVKEVYGQEIDLGLLNLAARETIAQVSEDGYIGILVNTCRDVAQQYA